MTQRAGAALSEDAGESCVAPSAVTTPPVVAGAHDHSTLSLRRYGVAGLLAGLLTVVGAVAGSTRFASGLPGAWFFGTSPSAVGSAVRGTPALSVLAVYGGLLALCVIWWRLLRTLGDHPGTGVGRVAGVIAWWAVPFLLAPPLFSRDVYSYAGQGAMVSYHISPYLYGPGVLGATPFNLLAGPLWANTPSPYGPTFLWLDGMAATVSGHQELLDLILLRLIEVAGVALMVLGLPVLARAAGRDPARAVLLGAGSPLVLATLVGGAHNDGLMVGLLVAGLAAWKRFGPVPGIVLCALAAGVKFPALLGVILIGWNWAPAGANVWQRVRRTLGAFGIGVATLGVVSAFTGLGWGWVTTATAADKIHTGVTPVDAVAMVVGGALHLVGAGIATSSVRGVASVLGALAAVALGTWWLWRSPRTGPVRALGLALLVLAVLSPVLWAWYVTWGLVVLAPVASGRLRRGLVALAVAETLIGAASVSGTARALFHHGPLATVLVVVGIAACGLVARAVCDGAYGSGRGLLRVPWFGQRATQPLGVTVTASHRPQSAQ